MEYTKKDALNAVRTVYPKAKNAVKINRGYSHEIYEVETLENPKSVIVRFSNNSLEKYSLSKEIHVNNLLLKAGLPAPKVIKHDKSKTLVPYEFVISSKMDGEDLDSIWDNLNKRDQEEISFLLGEILGKIHNIKLEEFGILTSTGIDGPEKFKFKQVGKSNINPAAVKLLSDSFSDLGKLSAHKDINPKLITKIQEFLTKNRKLAETSEEPTLIHGDFDKLNFKVKKINKKWIISAIFDFEYASSTVREFDFIKLHRSGFLTQKNLRDALLKGYKNYQKVGKDFDKKVEYFRLMRDVGFVFFLLKAGNDSLAKKFLDRIKEVVGY